MNAIFIISQKYPTIKFYSITFLQLHKVIIHLSEIN